MVISSMQRTKEMVVMETRDTLKAEWSRSPL